VLRLDVRSVNRQRLIPASQDSWLTSGVQPTGTGVKPMLDGVMRRLIDPALTRLGRVLVAWGVKADQVTWLGFAAGMGCAVAVTLGLDTAALGLLFLGRLADGLDGAVARETGPKDRGGFLDITLDFIFYASVPLAFALRDPAQFALPAAILLAAFYANGASFLAFAVIAAKRGMTTQQRGSKSLYFTAGLTEGTETIIFFVTVILLPAWFATFAFAFSALCVITCLSRIILGWRVFGVDDAVK
jgi:phosphatidylglycerophosphate synthase